MPHTPERRKCAGCGTERLVELYDNQLVDVELAAGITVSVCRGRGMGRASDDCVRRARDGKCPGCGEKIDSQSGVLRPVLCAACKGKLALGAAQADRKLGWTSLTATEVFGGYVGERDRELPLKALAALVGVVGGRTYRAHGEDYGTSHGHAPPRDKSAYGDRTYADVQVECTAEQHAALCELTTLLARVGDALIRRGFAAGNDVLGGLVRGETTIDKYDDAVVRQGPKKEEG